MPNRKDRTQALAARSRFWIDDLHVQPDRCTVMRGKQEIKLELRMMEVMVMLAEHAGETITKERLLVEVWGSEIYGDSPVSRVISLLRDLIGDNARNPRYIETVSKVGYRMIATVTLAEDYRRMPPSPWKEGSPYVGLSAYDAKHSPVFCGRGRNISDLLCAMRSQMENERRFVMIVGASGCGKTSLLRAGAIPLLTKPDGFEGVRALSVADCDLAAAHLGDPLTPLVAALATWTLDNDPVFPPQTTEQLKSQLCDSPDMVADLVAERLRRHFGSNLDEEPFAHLLLTIDHAEALVASADIDTKAREAFERLVIVLCDCPHVLVTMITRSDFYPKLTEALPALAERKAGDGHLDVLPPRRGEIGEIIRTPAWKANLSFEMDPDSRNRLDDVLRDAAVAQPDALPLLQHTLDMLYDRCKEQRLLTFAIYHEIGGLEGAIAHRAKEVFSTLPASAQDSLDSVLSRLIVVQIDSDAVSARRTYSDDFRDGAKTLVDAFIAARLFVGDHSDGRATVGVAHEALLRRWPKAVEWIQDNRRLLQAKARLQRAAARWKEEKKSADHLLNSGRPLSEAEEAACEFSDDLRDDEREFLRASQHLNHRNRRLKRTALSILASLTIAMTIMAVAAVLLKIEADANRRKAIDLVGYNLVDLADELRPTGNTQSLDSISTHALRLLEAQPSSAMDVDELINYSRALRIRGEVMSMQGKNQQAVTLFKRAEEMARRAIETNHAPESAIFESAQSYYWLGFQYRKHGDLKGAMTEWKRYLSESERLIQANVANPDWRMENLLASTNLGTLELQEFGCGAAQDRLKSSLFKMKHMIDNGNKRLSWQYHWLVTRSWVTRCHAESGLVAKASAEFELEIADLRALLEKSPASTNWIQQLSSLLHFSAIQSVNSGQLNDAESKIAEAIELLDIVTRLHPENEDWRRIRVSALARGGEVARLRGNDSLALARLSSAMTIVEKERPNGLATSWIRMDATIRFRIGRIQGSTEGESAMDASISDLEALKRINPDKYTLIALADALVSRGLFRRDHGRISDARDDWSRAKTTLEQVSVQSRDPEVLTPWIKACLLLDQPIAAEAHLQNLFAAGYRVSGLEPIRTLESKIPH